MKTALQPDGLKIKASVEAPEEAQCAYCGGCLILRRRKLMNNRGYTYYWRHKDNENLACPGRSRRD